MNTSSFESFEKEAKSQGFDEVTQKTWEPEVVLPEHTHPFDASAVVVAGDMWLTYRGTTRHITPGGTFVLPRDTPHAERYGSQGATYWVARRNR